MLYFSLSHFVYIISEGWKQFSKVGDVSLDKAKNSDEKGWHCNSNAPVYGMNS